jgi:ABC-type bacteriocin/lantibiotic exporter with double-glycine peptidase domain
MWSKKLPSITPIKDILNLPTYGFQFFFRNIQPFFWQFLLLSLCAIGSCLLRFTTIFFLGDIISKVTSLTIEQIFWNYLVIWCAAMFCAEILDFFIRRYSEALPTIFAEYTSLRFHLTFLQTNSFRLMNFSKEKLLNLTSKYVSNVQAFLNDWVWGIPFRATRLCIIGCILLYQDIIIFLAAVVYILFFLKIALSISSRFAPVAKSYSLQSIETNSLLTSFLINLNSLKRLSLFSFYTKTSKDYITKSWQKLDLVRDFHAKRWFFQLNLFNALYIATMCFGVYQVKNNFLPIGYLVLIKWSFDELWQILVYVIEFYVSLVQQKQDSGIVKTEFARIFEQTDQTKQKNTIDTWQEITIKNVSSNFLTNDNTPRPTISIPQLFIRNNSKIGIIGSSGVGKTTILNILLNLVPYEGSYKIDSKDVKHIELNANLIAIINSIDPLFKFSLLDNILLGRNVSEKLFKEIIEGTKVSEFQEKLELNVGDPQFNLSAGQEQRIRLARGLISESSIYLLDEPFNGIDLENKKNIINFLKRFLKDKAIVLVTHSHEELELIEKVYQIVDGKLRDSQGAH